jgi:hypothetical protein
LQFLGTANRRGKATDDFRMARGKLIGNRFDFSAKAMSFGSSGS